MSRRRPAGRLRAAALAQRSLTFGEVLRLIDGPDRPAALPIQDRLPPLRPTAQDEATCEIRHVFARVTVATREVLDRTTSPTRWSPRTSWSRRHWPRTFLPHHRLSPQRKLRVQLMARAGGAMDPCFRGDDTQWMGTALSPPPVSPRRRPGAINGLPAHLTSQSSSAGSTRTSPCERRSYV